MNLIELMCFKFKQLIFVLVFTSLYTHAAFADVDIDNDGLIEINNLEMLNNVRNNLQGLTYDDGTIEDSTGCGDGVVVTSCFGYELTTDLDFDTNGNGLFDSNDDYWNGGEGWDPIGSGGSTFKGTFEGNGFVIKNLTINRPNLWQTGLFARLSSSAEVLRLGVVDAQVIGRYMVGAVAGDSNGLIKETYMTGNVSGYRSIGGITGENHGEIRQTFALSTVSATLGAGGIVSANVGGSILDSYSISAVTAAPGTRFFGGLLAYSGSTGSTIQRSFTSSTIAGSGLKKGAFLGHRAAPTNFDSNYYDSTKSLTLPAIGNATSTEIISFTAEELECPTAPDNTTCAGATLFDGWDPAIWDFGDSTQLPALLINGIVVRDSDGDGTLDAFDDGVDVDVDVDGDGLIEISSLEMLHNIRNNKDGTGYNNGFVNDSSGCGDGVTISICSGYELTEDLDFDTNSDGVIDDSDTYWNDGKGWDPIGDDNIAFNATFEGNGFTIKNLVINRPSKYFVGLFGYISSLSKVQRLGLVDVDIIGNLDVGAVAGQNDGIIKETYMTGTVSGYRRIGGIAGTIEGEIRQSFALSDVSGTIGVGGLTSTLNSGGIYDSYSISTVQAINGYAGGLLALRGNPDVVIERSFTSSIVASSSNSGVGAFIGCCSEFEDFIIANHYDATKSGALPAGASITSNELTSYSNTELKCPIAPDNTSCASGTLYDGWSSAIWDFSDSNHMPTLIINGVAVRDSDGDGILDAFDPVDDLADDDLDGVNNGVDLCQNTSSGESVNINGCGLSQLDTDLDSVNDALDLCPDTQPSESVDQNGCSSLQIQIDSDGDGTPDYLDVYPYQSAPLQCTA